MPVELLLPGRRVQVPPPPTYLRGDWRFGVGAGALAGDRSRYNNHGTITNATWVQLATGEWVLDFTGGLDHVDIPATATQLDFTTENFTVLFWIYARELANLYPINRGGFNANGWQVQVDGAGGLRFHTNQALANQVSNAAGGTVILNTWQHFGIRRVGAVVDIWRNGVLLVIGHGVHIDPLSVAMQCQFGRQDCRMDLVRILGIGMVTSEVLAVFNSQRVLLGV